MHAWWARVKVRIMENWCNDIFNLCPKWSPLGIICGDYNAGSPWAYNEPRLFVLFIIVKKPLSGIKGCKKLQKWRGRRTQSSDKQLLDASKRVKRYRMWYYMPSFSPMLSLQGVFFFLENQPDWHARVYEKQNKKKVSVRTGSTCFDDYCGTGTTIHRCTLTLSRLLKMWDLKNLFGFAGYLMIVQVRVSYTVVFAVA